MRPIHLKLVMAGGLSVLFYLGITVLSFEFNWGEGYLRRPIMEYVLLYLGAFVLYAVAVGWTLKARSDSRSLWLILLFGLLFRAVLVPAHQIQEDDIYRYLWDGKSFGNHINPYKYSPEEVTFFKQFMIREPTRFANTYDAPSVRELQTLATLKWDNERALKFMERINHPHLPTIYPPLAQYVFRGVYHLAPDSIVAMRLAFGLFDLAAFAFIVLTLRALGKSQAWSIIYFWSPLIIKETYNSTHLDIIGVAMLSASLYFLVKMRHVMAQGFLGLSVVSKFYPTVLLPFYLKDQWLRIKETGESKRNSLLIGVVLFSAVVLLLYLPFLDIGMKAFASLKTFSVYWESNDSIFAILVWFYREVLGFAAEGPVGFSFDMPSLLAKITVASVLGAVWLFLFFWAQPADGEKRIDTTLRHLFLIMGLIFLLSPVQNPWYLCWVVPFLCLFPHRSWILLTGLMGLYYLEFFFDYHDLYGLKAWLPWFEYLPFYALLGWDWYQKRRILPS